MIALDNPSVSSPTQVVIEEMHEGIASNQTHAGAGEGTPFTSLFMSGEEEGSKITVPITHEMWTKSLDREFLELAERAAFLNATEEEMKRFAQLQVLRRQLKHPRTGEEVIWEYKQRQLTRQLVSALKEYVHFHQESNNPWANSKENFHPE
jgi:hypothetical protein